MEQAADLEQIDVYVICAADAIAPHTAVPFSLSRTIEAGESRPFPIVVVRQGLDEFYAYVNACPHNGIWLNVGDGSFYTGDYTALQCGRHGAEFQIETGICTKGPCEGERLQVLPIAVIDGDICMYGIDLAEDDGIPDPFADPDDETMDIMIHPD